MSNVLDDISAEVANLSDEEIATAAAKIQARRKKAQSSMTEERKQKGKEREKRRRLLDKAILAQAKAKGLTGQAEAPTA